MLCPMMGTCSNCSNMAVIIGTYSTFSFGNNPPPENKGIASDS